MYILRSVAIRVKLRQMRPLADGGMYIYAAPEHALCMQWAACTRKGEAAWMYVGMYVYMYVCIYIYTYIYIYI